MKNRMNSDARRALFSGDISRKAVLESKIPTLENTAPLVVNIWRNSGVEAYLPVLEKYHNFFGFRIDFKISAYDNSFDIRDRETADLDLIYVSLDEIKVEKIWELLEFRVADLISRGSKNISIAIQTPPEIAIPEDELNSFKTAFPGIRFLIVSKENMFGKGRFQDKRLETISANWLAFDAYAFFGRQIALNLILPFFVTRIKLIAVDLDNTLYEGVIAEDGVNGISQSSTQSELIKWLQGQKDKGILLGVVTRNVVEDVENLYQKFPKWRELFDFVHASWEPKETHIQELLQLTRISAESIMFIDDSIFEIENVQKSFPSIQSVLFTDEESTISFMQTHPGLGFKGLPDVRKIDRAADLKSNAMRDSIFSVMSDREAFKMLEVKLNYEINNLNLIQRCGELSNKTNQFNFALNRYSDFELRSYMASTDKKVVLSNLQDKYADSGIVSLLCVNYSKPTEVVVDEFCISCRAIGRGLEDEIFFGSLSRALDRSSIKNIKSIKVPYQTGERNSPAIDWANNRKWVVTPSWIEIPIESLLGWQTLITGI